MNDGHRVILAGTGRSGVLLKTTFPNLLFLALPSPLIQFGEGKYSYLRFSLQLPGLVRSVFREHRKVKKIVSLHHVDIIISDNRYGLFCHSAYTIFITHQISPVLPGIFQWLEYPLYRLIRSIINLYDECWIPDSEDPRYNLSGKLSHRYTCPQNARFIGILSRFCSPDVLSGKSVVSHYDLAVVLSGPEPQISAFEKLICKQLETLPKTAIIIKGLRGSISPLTPNNRDKLSLISHLETTLFARVLLGADRVICRSGYTSIMDLVALGIHAIIVPSPGQSEQEYLANNLEKKGWFQVVQQNDLDLACIFERTAKRTLPDFHLLFIHPGSNHFQDLYRKYDQNSKKSDQKT